MAANPFAHEVIAVYRRVWDHLELRLYRDGECYYVWPSGEYQFGAQDVTFEQIEQWLLRPEGRGFMRVDEP